MLAGGIFLYGLLYNYMYAPNLVRKAPVAVVDLSHSALSREYVRWLDAAPQTSVRARTPNILEAREWMKKGEVTGILYIPSDFETRVARGETSVFTLYAATDAFLNFKGLQEAASRVMLAVNDAHRPAGAVFLPPQGLLAVASSAPVNVSGTALYNYTEGYGSYLIPAVMIVIIFQTMLMVIAMLTGEEAEERRKGISMMNACSLKDALRIVSGSEFCICNAVCGVLVVPAGIAPAHFQYSQYRQRIGHCRDDDTFSACHKFLCACPVPLVHRPGSPATDDSILFCGLHLPFGRFLSSGTDALVLAGGALHFSRSSRGARFRPTEFNGCHSCRHLASDADAVDTSNRVRCMGIAHCKA